jgi:hypothetical protein
MATTQRIGMRTADQTTAMPVRWTQTTTPTATGSAQGTTFAWRVMIRSMRTAMVSRMPAMRVQPTTPTTPTETACATWMISVPRETTPTMSMAMGRRTHVTLVRATIPTTPISTESVTRSTPVKAMTHSMRTVMVSRTPVTSATETTL